MSFDEMTLYKMMCCPTRNKFARKAAVMAQHKSTTGGNHETKETLIKFKGLDFKTF